MNKNIFNAEGISSVLAILMLFSIMFISYNKWQQSKLLQQNKIYQSKQAMSIAENQIALKMSSEGCESNIKQNGIEFKIQCRDNAIVVSYPLGKFELKK